jgi:hypothetical protein
LNELYYSHLINSQATTYGFKSNDAFAKHANTVTKQEISKNLNKTNWAYQSAADNIQNKGVSVHSLRAAKLMAGNNQSDALTSSL